MRSAVPRREPHVINPKRYHGHREYRTRENQRKAHGLGGQRSAEGVAVLAVGALRRQHKLHDAKGELRKDG